MSEATDLQFIDTHLHLIDRRRARLSWTEGFEAFRGRDFPLEEAEALAGGRVKGRIFMEVDADPDQIEAEARWIAGLIGEGRLLGQIAACRPEEPGIEPWLEECRGLGVVGLRRILHTVPDDVSQSDLFRENVRRIGRAGFTFDMNFLGRTLPIAYDLARACDGMTLILDHCGTPDIAGGGFAEWRAGLARLAELPHVWIKFSGISAYAAPGTASDQVLMPYADTVLELFGPARMVWGSDWPVCNLGLGMAGWIDFSERVLARLSRDEAEAIAWRNATRVYGVAA